MESTITNKRMGQQTTENTINNKRVRLVAMMWRSFVLLSFGRRIVKHFAFLCYTIAPTLRAQGSRLSRANETHDSPLFSPPEKYFDGFPTNNMVCLSDVRKMKFAYSTFGRLNKKMHAGTAKRPKSCQPRMPHAVATRLSHIYNVMLTAMNSARRCHNQFFCSRPRTSAGGKKVSPATASFQTSKMVSPLVRRSRFFSIYF